MVEKLVAMIPQPDEPRQGPTLFAVDHCFKIKGQGAVMTGTMLQVEGCVDAAQLHVNTTRIKYFALKIISLFRYQLGCVMNK